jgi:phosphopentomutase
MPRACVIVLDAVGAGELPDAADYGDEGSNTLANVADAVGGLDLPNLEQLGLGNVEALAGCPPQPHAPAVAGRLFERSKGKDTTTGHWELMGIVTPEPMPTFPHGFPFDVIEEFAHRTGRGVLGNKAASGTEIIEELGEEHQRTGKWIVYTSADSVFQIAAHEETIPLEELYAACGIAREILTGKNAVGRVIARPFVGGPGHFKRTTNRRDYALPPRGDTLLDRVKAAALPVIAIGKIEDLFAGRGITTALHTISDDDGMDRVEEQMESVDRGLIFTNLVDFDTQYGHRNDVEGYARNLERFDGRLARVLPRLRRDDLLVVTADHGNDPTTASTDHAREYVPLMVAGAQVRRGVDLGTRRTFADLGQTLAEVFGVAPLTHGTSFLREIVEPARS